MKRNATHFASADEFRQWLLLNHATVVELWVGFHRKSSRQVGMTYPEAVDEALCFGWIDGVVNKLDATRFTHRFTPRRPGSIWSNVNVGHVERLTKAGRMHAAGLKAFSARREKKTGVYSFENASKQLSPDCEKRFRANKKAWAFFTAQAPWYQRLLVFKIAGAKQEATRERWLARVIEASAAGRKL